MAKVFCANLPNDITEEELRAWFDEKNVQVTSVTIMRDLFGGQVPVCYAELVEGTTVQEAVSALNGQNLRGYSIRVA